MNRMRFVSIATACGRIRHVSLETFVSAVESLEWDYGHVTVDIRNGYKPSGFPSPNWERKHFFFDKKPILEQIVPQLEQTQLIYNGLETVHKAALLSAVENGYPEMMVRISPRKWMIANPRDFRVFSRNGALIIVCIHPKRNFLIDLSRDITRHEQTIRKPHS